MVVYSLVDQLSWTHTPSIVAGYLVSKLMHYDDAVAVNGFRCLISHVVVFLRHLTSYYCGYRDCWWLMLATLCTPLQINSL